jgi:salicylate hydroxylase
VARSRTLIVAGAGIGGLSAAIALSRAGFRVIALERAAKLEEIGAGIQLSPNATHALDALGVLDALRPHAIEPRLLVVSDGARGTELARADLAGAGKRFGAPFLLVARADLQRVLAAAALDNADIVIEPGTELVDFADHARGVTVSAKMAGASSEQFGAALIGADGLRSRVRARLFGQSAPQFHRLVAWRALIPAKGLPALYIEPVVRLWLGPNAHMVHYPVANGEMVNLVAIFTDGWQGEDGSDADIGKIPHGCDTWTETPQYLIAAAKKFRRFALYDRPPLAAWGKGRVTLLGDAAHPTLPFVAQGAAGAIEDALALSRHLQDVEEAAPALRAYEAERAPRAQRLQETARATGRIYHLGGVGRLARNFFLRQIGGAGLIERHAWIYRHRESAPESAALGARARNALE